MPENLPDHIARCNGEHLGMSGGAMPISYEAGGNAVV